MFTDVGNAFSDFKQLFLGAFSIGLTTRTPLIQETTMNGLAEIQKSFPELSESSFSEENKIFKMENDEPEPEKQLLFQLKRSQAFDFNWGLRAKFGEKKDILKLFDCFQNGFGLQPINVELVDFKIHSICDWDSNHYKVIWKAFFEKSPIFGLFDLDSLLQSDLGFRCLLGNERVCAVVIESNVQDVEIRKQKFKNDRLKVKVGIAQTKKIPLDARLAEVVENHISVSLKFVLEKFIPYVISPLDKTIIEMATKR